MRSLSLFALSVPSPRPEGGVPQGVVAGAAFALPKTRCCKQKTWGLSCKLRGSKEILPKYLWEFPDDHPVINSASWRAAVRRSPPLDGCGATGAGRRWTSTEGLEGTEGWGCAGRARRSLVVCS